MGEQNPGTGGAPEVLAHHSITPLLQRSAWLYDRITQDVSVRGRASVAAPAEVAQVPAAARGHSFKVEIVVAGECDPRLGWLMDYADISRAFKPIWERLDHYYLNEVPSLDNPTG